MTYVKAVYSNIYGIRYTLNLVSGLLIFGCDTDNTTSVAIDTIAKPYKRNRGHHPSPLTRPS